MAKIVEGKIVCDVPLFANYDAVFAKQREAICAKAGTKEPPQSQHLVNLVGEIARVFRNRMEVHVRNVAEGYRGDLLGDVNGRNLHPDCPRNHQAMKVNIFGIPVGPQNFTELLQKAIEVLDFPAHGFKVIDVRMVAGDRTGATLILAFPQFSMPTEEAPHIS